MIDERMSDVDALVLAVEQDPRQRTTIAALIRFDRRLDPVELRHRIDRASRVVPRLRQRIIHDPVQIAAPRWSIDTDFQLARHFRVAHLSHGDEATLATLVRDVIVQPFDRAHPLWEFTLIDGLDGDQAALLLKSHHCVSDGVGGVTMMLELFDLAAEADPERSMLPPAPTADNAQPTMGGMLTAEAGQTLRSLRTLVDLAATPRSIIDITTAARNAGEALGSAVRMFRPSAATALPSGRSAGLNVSFFSVALADVKTAGARTGGTINDAFVAGVAIGVGDHFGAEPDTVLRIAIPINTRDGSDDVGNHWTPGRVDLAIGTNRDPDTVVTDVREGVALTRDEPAHQLLTPLAGALRRLPPAASLTLVESMAVGLDLAASNVPGSPIPLYLCGQEVQAVVPFGPLSGCAANVTLMSYAGTAHISVSTDPAAVTDHAGLVRNIEAGMSAVIKAS
jgi:diacylglycerol O-acyltransferase